MCVHHHLLREGGAREIGEMKEVVLAGRTVVGRKEGLASTYVTTLTTTIILPSVLLYERYLKN